MKQQFQKGDHVKIADDLGASMRHFPAGLEAIVIGSYFEQYGGGESEKHNYTLHVKGRGQCSWYYGHQLTLLETQRLDLLKTWEDEESAEDRLKGSHEWIFEHGTEVLAGASGATLETLGKDLGITNLWGSHGEGVTYYANARVIMEVARQFLEARDQLGWISFAAAVRLARITQANGPSVPTP